jgi:hypothetical protein
MAHGHGNTYVNTPLPSGVPIAIGCGARVTGHHPGTTPNQNVVIGDSKALPGVARTVILGDGLVGDTSDSVYVGDQILITPDKIRVGRLVYANDVKCGLCGALHTSSCPTKPVCQSCIHGLIEYVAAQRSLQTARVQPAP